MSASLLTDATPDSMQAVWFCNDLTSVCGIEKSITGDYNLKNVEAVEERSRRKMIAVIQLT